MRCSIMVLIGVMLAGGATRVAAQGAAVELGVGGLGFAGDVSAFRVGVRGTTARAGAVGLDGSIATYPDHLHHAFNLLSDVGLEYRPRLGGIATGSVHAGGSLMIATVFGLNRSGAGFNAGGGATLQVGPGAGLRMDYTYRLLFSGGEHVSLSSVTVGVFLGH